LGLDGACFSDQVTHAAMSGRYMMEQTFQFSALNQNNAEHNPLAILRSFTGKHNSSIFLNLE
jgi:hypothetical protein